MDTGPTLLQREVEIGPDETAPELAARMSELGADLIAESLLRFDRGEISPVPQENSQASYAPILKKENGRIDWRLRAQDISDRMRGFTPWPGSYSTFRGQTCQLWGRPGTVGAAQDQITLGGIITSAEEINVVCGEGTSLRLDTIQIEGRKKISAREFANGARLDTSEHFI
jgi:methionyl-tRNA formyltransferase